MSKNPIESYEAWQKQVSSSEDDVSIDELPKEQSDWLRAK